MGVYLEVNSYKKDNRFILAEMKSVGLFEVNLDKIESFNPQNHISFWDTIYSFHELAYECWNELENNDVFVSRSDIAFFDLIPNRMGGENIAILEGDSIAPMFDPAPILRLTEAVVENHEWLFNTFSYDAQVRIIETDELKNLKTLQILLKEAVEKDLIIGMSYT